MGLRFVAKIVKAGAAYLLNEVGDYAKTGFTAGIKEELNLKDVLKNIDISRKDYNKILDNFNQNSIKDLDGKSHNIIKASLQSMLHVERDQKSISAALQNILGRNDQISNETAIELSGLATVISKNYGLDMAQATNFIYQAYQDKSFGINTEDMIKNLVPYFENTKAGEHINTQAILNIAKQSMDLSKALGQDMNSQDATDLGAFLVKTLGSHKAQEQYAYFAALDDSQHQALQSIGINFLGSFEDSLNNLQNVEKSELEKILPSLPVAVQKAVLSLYENKDNHLKLEKVENLPSSHNKEVNKQIATYRDYFTSRINGITVTQEEDIKHLNENIKNIEVASSSLIDDQRSSYAGYEHYDFLGTGTSKEEAEAFLEEVKTLAADNLTPEEVQTLKEKYNDTGIKELIGFTFLDDLLTLQYIEHDMRATLAEVDKTIPLEQEQEKTKQEIKSNEQKIEGENKSITKAEGQKQKLERKISSEISAKSIVYELNNSKLVSRTENPRVYPYGSTYTDEFEYAEGFDEAKAFFADLSKKAKGGLSDEEIKTLQETHKHDAVQKLIASGVFDNIKEFTGKIEEKNNNIKTSEAKIQELEVMNAFWKAYIEGMGLEIAEIKEEQKNTLPTSSDNAPPLNTNQVEQTSLSYQGNSITGLSPQPSYNPAVIEGYAQQSLTALEQKAQNLQSEITHHSKSKTDSLCGAVYSAVYSAIRAAEARAKPVYQNPGNTDIITVNSGSNGNSASDSDVA